MKVNIPETGEDSIEIETHDTWGMDETLSKIILPMLIQLKETKHGSPHTDQEDSLIEGDIHERWDNILDQMIWSFDQKVNGSEDKFYKEIPGKEVFETYDIGKGDLKRCKINLEVDREGLEAYNKKMQAGFTMFGKYYTALWD